MIIILEFLTKKQKIIFFITLLIMVIIIIYYLYSTLYSDNFSSAYENTAFNSNNLVEFSNNLNINVQENNTIIVYVCGAVKESKVVSLIENSRVCDAINAAGGITEEADLTTINLAYILEDGEKIYIPKKGEDLSSISQDSSTTVKNRKININKATQTELETIPGIGPSTALKIINYRKENGKFSSIEDIKNISGIGDTKYENIKNHITIK